MNDFGSCVLSIDQGTTNTKAVLVEPSGTILARASAPLTTAYPQPGWVEQSANDIWQSVQSVISDIVIQCEHHAITAIAIANQRETLVCWDAKTSEPITPAIIWQCRRTAQICEQLRRDGHGSFVEQTTGLSINPLFPASKLGWVMQNVPEAEILSKQNRLRVGTVDAWLLWKLTGAASFATDHSNASRTQLFDTEIMDWSEDLCAIFKVPFSALPKALPSDSKFGITSQQATALPANVPICAMMGDSHAALFGHGIHTPGRVKATYGTGSSLMTVTKNRVMSQNGLSSTIAWSTQNGPVYALEGNITVSAQAAAFMSGLLGVSDVHALTDLAKNAENSNGVAFVPALAGLGAPHWDDDATGLITGLTHTTTPSHVARATFEAIAHQICDVFDAMEMDAGAALEELSADGGASSNGFLMRLQADLLGKPLVVGDVEEVGALGAAALAFQSLGQTKSHLNAKHIQKIEPKLDAAARARSRENWKSAIKRARALV